MDEYTEILSGLRNGVLPERTEVLRAIALTKEILRKEPNLLVISGPTTVFGDTHGQFYDFLEMISLSRADGSLLFLGDYVDRGMDGVELLLTLLLIKIRSPKNLFLLRGNHECREQTSSYGFKGECLKKYDPIVYWAFCDLFLYLPLCAVVNKQYFCVHGGITPDLSLELIRQTDRISENFNISDILWGDPDEGTNGFSASTRGAGFLFGKDAALSFCQKFGFKKIVRSHQLVREGIRESLGASL